MFNMNTIFLDLEETVIDNWFSGNFLSDRSSAIKDFIDRIPGDKQFGVMSWAILNQKDKRTFNNVFREPLEDFFETEFVDSLILSVEDWRKLCNKNFRIQMSPEDFADFGTKESIMFWLRNANADMFPSGNIFLFDDVISHGDLIIGNNNRTIKFINSKHLHSDS